MNHTLEGRAMDDVRNAAMAEALRLTKAGRLTEASALLQQRLAADRFSPPSPAESGAADVISPATLPGRTRPSWGLRR